MSEAVEPLPRELLRALRDVVGALRTRYRSRRFPWQLHLGDPRSAYLTLDADPRAGLDDALRTEVVGALLARGRERPGVPMVWLTRPGELAWHDLEAAWLAPCRRAYAEAGVPLTLVVVTKRGWYDPRSGQRREWLRLRTR